jgi:hypothetical protein
LLIQAFTDGNTVMAIYVSFPIPPADLDTHSNGMLPSGIQFAIKSCHVWQEAYKGQFAGVKPNLPSIVTNGQATESVEQIPQPWRRRV